MTVLVSRFNALREITRLLGLYRGMRAVGMLRDLLGADYDPQVTLLACDMAQPVAHLALDGRALKSLARARELSSGPQIAGDVRWGDVVAELAASEQAAYDSVGCMTWRVAAAEAVKLACCGKPGAAAEAAHRAAYHLETQFGRIGRTSALLKIEQRHHEIWSQWLHQMESAHG